MLLLYQLFIVAILIWCTTTSCRAFQFPLHHLPPTHHQHRQSTLTTMATSKSSLEVNDTDDEYYSQLFQEEFDDDEEDFDFMDGNVVDKTKGNTAEQQYRVNEYVYNRKAVEQRKLHRRQVKRTRRLQEARKMALNTLGYEKPPKNPQARQRFRAAKGVFARLLEVLEIRQENSKERAREYVVDREAQLASLHAMDEDKQRVNQLEYLESIEGMRQQEANHTRILTEFVLSSVLPEESAIEELSNEDIITVLRVRGNVKGARKHSKRKTLLGLLRKSFNTPLF